MTTYLTQDTTTGPPMTPSRRQRRLTYPAKAIAGAEGLEPATAGFGDRCSAKLSYTPKRLTSPNKFRHQHPSFISCETPCEVYAASTSGNTSSTAAVPSPEFPSEHDNSEARSRCTPAKRIHAPSLHPSILQLFNHLSHQTRTHGLTPFTNGKSLTIGHSNLFTQRN